MSVQAPAPAPAASLLYFNNRRVIPLHQLLGGAPNGRLRRWQ